VKTAAEKQAEKRKKIALKKLRELCEDQNQAKEPESPDYYNRKKHPFKHPEITPSLCMAQHKTYGDVVGAYNAFAKFRAGESAPRPKNPLTSVIPGYRAPMRLQSNFDLTKCTSTSSSSSVVDLKTAAGEHTRDSKLDEYARAMLRTNNAALQNEKSSASGSNGARSSVGLKGWFNMQGAEMTDELKADMKAIRMRNHLDPQKFYKRSDKFHKFVQVGTVIEGSAEYYSSRLTKKERRGNFVEELMADDKIRSYAKRKYGQIQKSTQNFVRYEKKRKGR